MYEQTKKKKENILHSEKKIINQVLINPSEFSFLSQ